MSRFYGYSIRLLIIRHESSIIFISLCPMGLNLSASHSQCLTATPMVSVVQKSVMSMCRCFLTFLDPLISTATTGRIAGLLLITDEIVNSVAEFFASVISSIGW